MLNPRIATYRLQLGPAFDFDQACAIIPYLTQLGISHLYLSPCLQAAKDSTHGYDVVDPLHVSNELGGEEAFAKLCLAAKSAGLAVMLDVVPNHLSIETDENPWWQSVLENGPSSKYAHYFNVDWSASEERWLNQVLLPVLPDHYGRILQKGQLVLEREGIDFRLVHGGRHFPIDLSTLGRILKLAAKELNSEVLAFLAACCERLPRANATKRELLERRHQDIAAILSILAAQCDDSSEVGAAIDLQIAAVNTDVDELDRLIQLQNYRLAV